MRALFGRAMSNGFKQESLVRTISGLEGPL